MKRFIVILTAFFCLSIAQDIAGSWNLTAVDVMYHNFARPNVATADPAFGDYQFQTPLYVTDVYGLGAEIPIAWLPPGYMFLGVPNGPFGTGGLAANGVNLNVTLYDDGTGMIPEGSTYPDIELDAATCITFGQVLPVEDEVIYSSDLSAGSVLPLTNIVGGQSANGYAGDAIGSMSLSQSVIFSFVPATPVHDEVPWPLFFGDGSFGTSLTPNENGMFETVGVTAGWCKMDGFDGSIGDDGPLSGGDNVDPELAYYWHSIDGYSADTGFGDDGAIYLGGTDEDGDGTDYDRIFGLPAISATTVDPGCAYAFGYGTSFVHNVAGDITGGLADLVTGECLATVAAGVYDGCIASVSAEVNGQCEAVFAGGVAQCMAATGYDEATCTAVLAGGPGGAAGLTVTYLANTIIAGLNPPLLDQCNEAGAYFEYLGMPTEQAQAYAVAALVENLCLGAGFDQEACAGGEDGGLVGLVASYGITTCAALDANSGTLAEAAAGLVESTDDNGSGSNCDEWAFSVADGFAEQSADTGYQTCTNLSAGLAAGLAAGDPTAIATLDAMAAGSPDTGYNTCTNFAAGTVASCTTVTTTDDTATPETINQVYLMNPAPEYALWGQFVTFNAYAYGLTGDPSLLVNDSDHDLDFENDFTFVSLATGQPCDPTSGDPYCAPYSANGGRLVFQYSPTCVPVIESVEVQTEFTGIEAGSCDANGDVDGNDDVNVLDVVALVQAVLGLAELSEEAACRADVDGNDDVNVLDIVSIVQSILSGRGEPATSAQFIRTDSGLSMTADGIVDAVQMTLSHGDDFSIELTDNALVAEYVTRENQTTFIIVAPESEELFSATGEYVIDEKIAANGNGSIPTSMPTSFNLSEAYPNPFNPSTSLDLTLYGDSDVSIMVYNVMGQMVGVLHEGNMGAGTHQITWDASELASGMYIIKANIAGDVLSNKVMLVK